MMRSLSNTRDAYDAVGVYGAGDADRAAAPSNTRDAYGAASPSRAFAPRASNAPTGLISITSVTNIGAPAVSHGVADPSPSLRLAGRSVARSFASECCSGERITPIAKSQTAAETPCVYRGFGRRAGAAGLRFSTFSCTFVPPTYPKVGRGFGLDATATV